MIADSTNMFSVDQAITANAASTNTIDLGATGTVVGGSAALVRDIGSGIPIPIRIQITEAFNNLTSMTFVLQTDDNSGFSSAATVDTVTLLLSQLTLGAFVKPLYYVPRGANERYLRLFYTVSGTAPTTGKVWAGIVAAHQENPA